MNPCSRSAKGIFIINLLMDFPYGSRGDLHGGNDAFDAAGGPDQALNALAPAIPQFSY
ncbi:hypothetical protein QF038_002337 [Pseudarthrobacter sp. W1I19]|nr:hypothetical protein [Pseudarthrobacter sp. W1I19]